MKAFFNKIIDLFGPEKPHQRCFEFSYPMRNSKADSIIMYSLHSSQLNGIEITLINEQKEKFQYNIPEVLSRHEKRIEIKNFLDSFSQPVTGTIRKVKVTCNGGSETFIKVRENFIFARKPGVCYI